MRTREYVEKGESEGKSLLDAMRDGETEGMQCFDDEIEKFVRTGVVDFETGLAYSTNDGNLRLALADMAESGSHSPREPARPGPPSRAPAEQEDAQIEIIR